MELYISLFSLVLSLTAIIVTYYSFLRTHKTSIQPMLSFYSEGRSENKYSSWIIENVGNGPALNVLIAQGDHNLKWNEENTVLISTIARGDKKRLTWILHPAALLAIYDDAHKHTYSTICHRNENKIFNGNNYPSLKPKHYQYQLNKNDIEIEK